MTIVQAKCSKCGSLLAGFVSREAAATVVCFFCDNPREDIPMSVDPDVSVYAIPVEIALKAEVYVLARSAAEARIAAAKTDIDDIFGGDEDSYSVDEPARANLIEAEAKWVTGDTKEATPRILPEEEYKVTDHPDYNKADHDEDAGDAGGEVDEVDPGRPEGMRS